jgi:hypothetical protein
MFPLYVLQNRSGNPDGQIGAEMNYFHGLKKAGFGWQGRVSGARA